MKIIITYASAGGGHRVAAEALYDYYSHNCQQVEVKLIDILDFADPWFAKAYTQGYSYLASRLSFLWKALFRISAQTFIGSAVNHFCRLHSKKFISYVLHEQPQAIITTHFFPAEIISYLKSQGKLQARLDCVITDFGVHPLWIQNFCDEYIVASEYTGAQLSSRGIPAGKIKVLGIPLRSGFSVARKVPHKEFRALLISGSFGFTFIEKIVEQLHSEIELIVVCGNNQELYSRLKKRAYSSVKLFGFTDQIPQLMAQADIMISKPGGVSIAEALAMELPLVFVKGIPGQETENARVIHEYGCAEYAQRLKDVKKIVNELRFYPEKLNLLRANTKKIRKPDSTKEICRYVCASSAGVTC